MRKKEVIFILLLLLFTTGVFFYKTIFGGLIPFPGDLLVSEYSPWATHSYLGYTPGTFPSKVQYFDTIRQIYPWKTLSTSFIRDGQFPLWNPYSFSGAPLLANFQSAVFYPVTLIFLIFPQVFAWTISVLLQPLLAAFFTYLFARKIGLGKIGSFFAAIAFGFSLFMTVFLEYNTIGHTILWLPLVLYLVEKILEKPKFLHTVFFVGALSFAFLAGHLQIFAFIFIFVFMYVVLRAPIKRWLIFLPLFMISLGISAMQLLPTLELIGLSARVPQDYAFLIEKLLIQPDQLILFLSPDFFGNPATRNYLLSDSYPGNALYIGAIPVIFVFFAVSVFKKNSFVKFFAVASLVLVFLFVRTPATELFYRLNIPFFSTGSPTNAIFLLSFSLSVLAGFGIEQWLAKNEKIFIKIMLAMGAIFGGLWVFIFFLQTIISTRNFIYSTIIMVIFAAVFWAGLFTKKKKPAALLLIIITIFDLFYFFHKFNPFVPKELVFPQSPIFNWIKENADINRIWTYGGAIEANFTTQYGIFSPDGYDPLYPARYGEFIQSSKDGKIKTTFTNQTRSDAVIASGYGENDLIDNSYRLKILDMLGVKYILDRVESKSSEKTFPADRFSLLYDKEGWKIFENKGAAPRTFLVSDYKIFKNKEEFEFLFFAKDLDVSKTILLEEEPTGISSYLNDLSHLSRVQVLSYSPNDVVIQIESDNDQLLFLSDTYYPGWKAFIEPSAGSGQVETKIYRANYAFRAAVVPAGNHRVVFRYQPASLALGIKITIISVVAAGLFALFINRKKIFV